jgi:hypothetical protein
LQGLLVTIPEEVGEAFGLGRIEIYGKPILGNIVVVYRMHTLWLFLGFLLGYFAGKAKSRSS